MTSPPAALRACPPLPLARDAAGVARTPATGTRSESMAGVDALTGTAVMLLLEARSPLWAFWRLVRGGHVLGAEPGLRWAKVLGSGRDGGFGLRPSGTRGGLFCVFERPQDAMAFVAGSSTIAAYRRHARECCALVLRPFSSRGSWGGRQLPTWGAVPTDGEIAVLTRASIRPTRAASFWRHAPPAQRDLEGATGCRLAVGLGEAPLLRQATFSLWDSASALNDYARRGAHRDASQSAQRDGYFTESMFVRFTPLHKVGTWKGQRLG